MNNRNNENLRNQMEAYTNMRNKLQRNKAMPNYQKYYTNAIAAIKLELNRRAKLKAKGHWKTLKGHVRARGLVGYLQRQTMRPPTRGGAGYQRLLRQTNLGKKRTRSVGTSMSPKRRNTSASHKR
jgi:hypothetical protein